MPGMHVQQRRAPSHCLMPGALSILYLILTGAGLLSFLGAWAQNFNGIELFTHPPQAGRNSLRLKLHFLRVLEL